MTTAVVAMSYDIDPEQRATRLENGALGGNTTINGLTLRPMTLGTWSLHHRLKDAALSKDDWTFDLFSFVWMHQAPEAAVREAFVRPNLAMVDIFAFMNSRSAADIPAFQPWVKEQMDNFAATLTKAQSEPGEGGSDLDPKKA